MANYRNPRILGDKGETMQASGDGSSAFPYVPSVGITSSTGLVDTFSRVGVSNPFTILDSKQLHDNIPLFFDDQQTSGSGTSSTYSDNTSSSVLSVSTNTAGTRVRQSKLRGIYQPGKSQLILITFTLGTKKTGITKRVGYFDGENGLFLEMAGSTVSLVRRTFVTGSAVDNKVSQSDWNIDKMDGTGVSGITLDFTKSQILLIEFEWLGVGSIRYGFVVDGAVQYVHQINNANNLAGVYMTTPNLPIRYEISNSGTGASDSLEAICASIISEGGQEDTSKTTYISRNGTPKTLANQDLYTPLISIRIGADHIGVRPVINSVDIMATGTLNYEWRLILNPTIAGVDNANWVNIANSCLEYDITRDNTNLVTGGYIFAGGYGSSTATSRTSINESIRSFLTIGQNIAGVSDQLVLAVANIDANGGTAYAGISVNEYL